MPSTIDTECPRHVAYVLTHYPRVATTFISDEIQELRHHGFEVDAIAMNVPTPDDLGGVEARETSERTFYLKGAGPLALVSAFLRQLRAHPLGILRLLATAVRTARLDAGVAARRLVHLIYSASVVERCRRTGVRHLHAHFGLAPATIAWFAAEIGNLDPTEHWTWSFTIHGFHDFVDETDARLDLKAASAAFVACVSDFTRSQLMRVASPTAWDRAHVVRCGIHLDRFALRPAQAMPEAPTLIVVARLSPEKGHLVLLQALERLCRTGMAPRALFVGSGPFEDELRHAASMLGIEDRVEFLGELEPHDVAVQLARADIFCLPSFSEGLPVSIMEAMAVGLPVVTTAISGIPELAVDGHTALTLPPGNPDALAAAIERLVSEPDLAAKLATAARTAVEEAHDIHRNVAQLQQLFLLAAR